MEEVEAIDITRLLLVFLDGALVRFGCAHNRLIACQLCRLLENEYEH